MGLTLITAPTIEPISLTEAKAHLRVTHTDDDTMIGLLIRAARQWIEGPYGFLGRALVQQTWRLTLDEFPATGDIKIPLPPLRSVVSVLYDDSGGVEQLLPPTSYFVDTASDPGWLVKVTNATWPTTLDAINTVRIDFIAGYAPTADSPPDLTANIPFNIKAALLLVLGNLYENREATVATTIDTLPLGVDPLLRQFKVHISMA
jgi:uncharacterized phiE125 gp8 family phage protein